MARQLSLGVKLPDTARFENYYPGPNAEPVDQIQRLAAGEILFLHGPVESGRSHLLQAACHKLADQPLPAFYLPMNDLRDTEPAVLEGIESAALVAFDDIDAIAGHKDWEEAVFHVFNRLRAAQVPLLISAADRPEALGFHLPDLVSRLSWGMIYKLQPVSDADRLAVLQLRAEQRGLALPDEVGEFLLKRMPRSLTALCELIDHLDDASLAAQRKLTIPFVKSVLSV